MDEEIYEELVDIQTVRANNAMKMREHNLINLIKDNETLNNRSLV